MVDIIPAQDASELDTLTDVPKKDRAYEIIDATILALNSAGALQAVDGIFRAARRQIEALYGSEEVHDSYRIIGIVERLSGRRLLEIEVN